MTDFKHLPKLLTLAIASLTTPLPTLAENLALEEVVVTARKREESLQDVPVAVTAFTAETMQSLGIKNMRDFDGLVPGLNLGGGGNGVKGDGNAYIRGVGQRDRKHPGAARPAGHAVWQKHHRWRDSVYVSQTVG
jgi:iron complex outermembrane receptor protein